MKLLTGNTSWLSTSLLGALALAYISMVFLPQQKRISALQDDLDEREQVLEQSQQLLPIIRAKENELAELREHNSSWESHAPSEAEVARLFGTITSQAKLAGVTTIRFEPQPSESMQFLRRIPVTLGLEGDFRGLFQFLRAIEALPHTIWVTELQLARAKEDADRVSCELNLEIFAVADEISD